jgi:hypothetical protein
MLMGNGTCRRALLFRFYARHLRWDQGDEWCIKKIHHDVFDMYDNSLKSNVYLLCGITRVVASLL